MPLDAGFLAMLTTPGVWTPRGTQDQWGNEVEGTPVPIKCFVSSQATTFGQDDDQNRQDNTKVTTMEIITDAVGISLKDKITVGGKSVYVDSVDTPKDELGVDLMHQITASTTERG